MLEERTGYVVTTKDPAHPGVTLFMVDRRSQRKSFWSNQLTDVFVYADKSAAEGKVGTLEHNSPRVMDWSEARSALRNNMMVK